ncbi:DNA translocase FtsK [Bacillus aquiflavi]|uniref:DNA translocase FtsK n=1 Tax=Bacillus aquiflavi TaxID=2672567 RepID=A0A6B3VWG8_9BACI|nr:DNA translocase FtsK [Bacillus aquiflavi]MBA4536249.1 DNA translocase FtsK [Bacillus aquiflavi]NEY80617.1 DNA translocase FtsK [Bacillus aquiflavi]UAC49992.1 DNA translocase FtsK [Bacillus aquiflavi]
MAKKKISRKGRKQADLNRTLKFELIGLGLITLSVITLARLGAVGKASVSFFRIFLGEWFALALLGLIWIGGYLMWKREVPYLFHMKLIGVYLIISSILLLSHVTLFEILSQGGNLNNSSVISSTWELFLQEVRGDNSFQDLGGGMFGAILFSLFYFLFAEPGAKIISFIMILIGTILLTGKPLGDVVRKTFTPLIDFSKRQVNAFATDLKEWKRKRNDKWEVSSKQADEEPLNEQNELVISPPLTTEDQEPVISSFSERKNTSEVADKTKNNGEEDLSEPIKFTELEKENIDYNLPPINILKPPLHIDQSGEYKLIHANAAKLERTFQSFGVRAKVTQVHLGPAVTKYEVHPDVGVKVSKIVSLSDDLALALAAKDIRIEAPIPGKSAIGIEVPNSQIASVCLREVLESKQNDMPDAKLLIGLGRDITGDAVLAQLNKMPHLLVAGATGSGKSVCINSIIISILMRAKPHEVKLMMIDPKMVELNVYNGVPHLLAPVVTDAKKASQALKKVVSEMERRYELFSHSGTRNIEGYNEYVKLHNEHEETEQQLLPYIVVVVDELADLMMVASSDVEDSITRLAQMARAAGIHLIIATQRPSVDVITGVIKANIPSRIAFAVSSQTDSRTILDMGGAEKLLGRGDMLFLPVGASKPVRVQGAFVSDHEVEEVVEFVISQQKAQYQENMIPDDIPNHLSDVEDELFEDAVQLVVEMQTASVSMLQRRFRIGYTRAARLIDEMEARGIVGPYEGSKPRTVLVTNFSDEASNE